MLRRLISAVFVLGLVLALNGTAVSDVVKGELNPVIKVKPTAQLYNDITDARPIQPTFKKPEDALKELPPGTVAPTPPQAYFCDVQDYTNGVPYYYWPIPDAYGDDLFNMRFTSDVGYACTTMTAHYMMYGTVMTGTPDMRCYIWDDNGFGFPGNKLDSVDIPYATLAANTVPIGYVDADFTHGGTVFWVFENGEEYHKGWTILQSGPGDTLAIVSDDASPPSSLEERASEYFSGMWGTILNDWGIDVSFFILNDRCCGEVPYSDCYYLWYYVNVAYYWRTPHPVYGVDSFTQRFSPSQPETLQAVDVFIYDPSDGSFGNDDIYISVLDDDGTGWPGAHIATVTLPAGTYPAFPAWATADFSAFNLVFDSDFHICFTSSGAPGVDYESCLSDDGSNPLGRGFCFYSGGWWDMLTLWGLDVNFLFDAYMCKDPYANCYWDWCYVSVDWYWRLPDAYGDYAHAQKFLAQGKECRVHEVCWYLYDNGDPDIYTHQSEVQVYSDAGGLPGTKLAGILIGPGSGNDYVLFPGAMCVDFEPLNVYVQGYYWVGIESFAPYNEGIRTLSDNGGGGCVDGLAENYLGTWELLWPYWGGGMPQDIAAVVEERQCCMPYEGLDCYPSEDWPTYQRDHARTGHSMNPVFDAWCDLTLNWHFMHPTQGIGFCGPIVAYDKVVESFGNEYIVFDLYNGTQLHSFIGAPIGSYVRSTPTVAMIQGYSDPVLFTSGGSSRTASAWNFNTYANMWTVTGTPTQGYTRWGRFTVVDMGGFDGVFWANDNGYIFGANALTGVALPGFPVNLGQAVYVAGATDGSHLFYNTFLAGVEGDVYSIDPMTGAIIWQLSATSGLQGVNVWTHDGGYNGDEGFSAGIMYNDGNIYTNSRATADYPTDGLFYSINAITGMVNYATLANRGYYQTPIMDANHSYMPSLTRWVSPPAGGNIYAVNKFTGVIEKTFTTAGGDRYYADAAVSCEDEDSEYPDDLMFAFGENGFLSCINTVTFEEVYRRRVDFGVGYPYNMGLGGAISHDDLGEVHVTFGTYWGCLFDMTKQDDRPRLEIESYNITTAVEFGSDPLLPIIFEDVFCNTGCADLHFDYVSADEDDCGLYIPEFASAVDPDFMDKAAKIADDLQREAYLSKYLRPNDKVLDEDGMQSVRPMDFEKESVNRAAAGWPPYLVSVDLPYVSLWLPPGECVDLALTVNQPLISRGPQCFYLTVGTNDPDFFLCDPDLDPCLYVCLVGGCLIDTTTLTFGMGCANTQLVTNTGRLGTGDWDPHAFDIDGDNASYYQGSYVYAVDSFRIAVHTQDWISGGGENDAFVSMQPDPNWCDDECKPALLLDVECGEITHDGGQTYTPVMVDKVCKNFLDSVQDFGYLGAWDWEAFGAPFSNPLTMGLYCKGAVYAACDVPELANVTVEVLQFHERNGNPVTGWYLGEMYDCDNGGDSIGIDRDYSLAWTYNRPAKDQAWGQIKIPFGCVCVCQTHADREPLINQWGTYGVSASHGFWNWIQFWDNCYNTYMTSGPGHFSDGNMSAGDEEAFVTFAQHDFAPHDTFEIAIAHFGLHDLTDASSSAEIAPLALLVNKWAGWMRGDVNNDNVINLADIIYLAATVNGGPGAVPFKHLSDVNADGAINASDVDRLIDFYFNCGVCPDGAWICDP